MIEAQRIVVSTHVTVLLIGMAVAAMFLLSRGAGMRQAGREREGRRTMAVGFVMAFAAIFVIPLIDLPWQVGEELRESLRAGVGLLGAVVLFAPIWWRALTNWLRGDETRERLVTWADLAARRSLPLTIGCVVVGLSIRAVAVFGM